MPNIYFGEEETNLFLNNNSIITSYLDLKLMSDLTFASRVTRVSKLKTLSSAIEYIEILKELLTAQKQVKEEYQDTSESWVSNKTFFTSAELDVAREDNDPGYEVVAVVVAADNDVILFLLLVMILIM